MPKVSVIIPAYNAMTFLPETLDSVFSQTFIDFEVIVVNDGSSDNIKQWASEITDLRFKLVSQENQGLSGARNTGIALTQGEYVAFLDADDLWEPTKLEKQVKSLDENPEASLVYTWTTLINAKGKPLGKILANYIEGDVWQELTKHNIVECGSVAMVRRHCFETVGNFDRNLGSYVEDWDMWLRIAARYPFKVIKEPLVYYRDHSNNVSKNWQGMEQSYCLVIEKNLAGVSSELQHLRKQSYGFVYLCLAWKPLQSALKDYREAIYFRQQALKYYPQLRFTKEYIRLSMAIALMRLLKSNNYEKTRSLFYSLRRYISSS
ncbi:glycosyltransferase family 2 protein [Gloeocapsopsis crepidinum LEGE 06123]|uniref:Glycosyltransferase family 2 protein n=1 Tax=Gloeocapsopsis crepidinum LEGE 06123 TaxID=588587 RepID=A0ABR9UKK2_9CHRO|nr:glycosyltransferase family A protein [Gloeocapsopsis crepidinum]MBE9188820.1 glycosyltransferase family 2 protein [Gloeocapsopsis crepidinum LEGE 06123]